MTETMIYILIGWAGAILIGMPIYLAMALAGIVFATMAGIPGVIVPSKIANAANNFTLLAAPFFIFMGVIMNASGVTTRLFNFAAVLVGWMRGGLCQANIVASVIFAGMSGSAVADAGGLGALEIKAMKDAGYPANLAASVTAASATIGPILPPSLPMVIYAVAAETSVGALFIGAVVPGLLMALALMILVRNITSRMDLPRSEFPSLKTVWDAFRHAFWALMTPVLLLGGIFGGVFTPTEAAVVAAAYALFIGVVVYRDFSIGDLPRVIVETVETTGVVMALVMTASLMSWALTIAQIPQIVGQTLAESITNPLYFLLIVNLVLIGVGLFMEAIAAMLILIPVLVPVANSLGIDPTQFGIVFVLNLMIGTITPPVGVVLFVTARVAGTPFESLVRAILPFLFPLIIVLVLITLFPALTTWLPSLVFG